MDDQNSYTRRKHTEGGSRNRQPVRHKLPKHARMTLKKPKPKQN